MSDLLAAPPPLESEEEPPVYKVSDEVHQLFENFAKLTPNLTDEEAAAEAVQGLSSTAGKRWNHRPGGGREEDASGHRGRGKFFRVHRAQSH